MSEERLVPKLRFSGFTENWNEVTLNDIATFSKGKGISKNDISNEGIECVRYGELYTKYDEIIYHVESKTNLDKDELKLSEKNDILIPCSGETAIDLATASCIQKDQVAIGGDITVIKTNQFAPFITYYLNQKKNEIAKYAQGVSIVHLYPKDFKVLDMKIPSINEQEKIIAIFEEITKKEQLLESKYREYQAFKKYLMQQIFTQKLRFDFKDEWKILRLNELVFYQEGPGVRNYQYTKTGVKLLNVGNFVKNVLELDNTDRYISEEEAYGKYNHFLVDEGDLLIACSGIKAEYFDEKIAFAEKKHLPLCMNTSTMRFKSLDENLLNLNYLKCYFQTESFKKQVFSVMAGSAQFNFGPTHLKYFKIPIPSIGEQKQIYGLFDSVDNKILKINEELEKVNEFKKSLLQQMFV